MFLIRKFYAIRRYMKLKRNKIDEKYVKTDILHLLNLRKSKK